MIMGFIRRAIFILLLLSFSQFSCFSQESLEQSTPSNTTEQTSPWDNIFNSLTKLEIESKSMSDIIQMQNNLLSDQEITINNLKTSYLDTYQLYLNSEANLKKSEDATKKWKNTSLVLGGVTVTLGISTITLIMILCNSR